jgi:hypothetical protein
MPITVILMCGRPDRMSVHTPDICYRGAGFDMVGEPVKATIPQRPDEFWTARFRQHSKAAGRDLRIFWTWGCHTGWRAPTSPRWTFGAQSFLYKLYIVHDDKTTTDPNMVEAEFLEQLLPVLDETLFRHS